MELPPLDVPTYEMPSPEMQYSEMPSVDMPSPEMLSFDMPAPEVPSPELDLSAPKTDIPFLWRSNWAKKPPVRLDL